VLIVSRPRYFVHGGLEPSDWRAFVFSKACATTSAMVALISIRRWVLSNSIRRLKASNVWRERSD